MTGPTIKPKREAKPRIKKPNMPLHTYVDAGEPIDALPFRARTFAADPEQVLADLFLRAGQDYGGPLPADAALNAVARASNVLHAAEMKRRASTQRRREAQQRPLQVEAAS